MLTEPEVIAFVTALVLLLQNVSGEMVRLQEVREECESASAAVARVHSAVTQMSQILACVLHDFRLANARLLLDEELGFWVKPRSTAWFSIFVCIEYDDLRWIQNFRMTKRQWSEGPSLPLSPPGPAELRRLFEKLGATYIKLAEMRGSGKENQTQKKRKINGEVNLKNAPKRLAAPATKHRIGRFSKGEGTLQKATGLEVREALRENTQSIIIRSLGPQETQFCSQSSTFVEMEVAGNQITELHEKVESIEKQVTTLTALCTSLSERLDAMELRWKRWEPILEQILNICGRAFFDKCIITFCDTARAHGYLKEGDNSFMKAWLDSAEAATFVATGLYSMVIFGKSIRITPTILERMKVFRNLSSAGSKTFAHQTTYLNVALSLTKNPLFQIPHVLDMFQELFVLSPKDVVEAFDSNCLNPFFLTNFKVY